MGLIALTIAVICQDIAGSRISCARDKECTSKLQILLVDDNSIDRKVLFLMLKYLGFHADTATNGKDAILALQRQFYHIILMDIQMPEMDGIQATKIIRQNWPSIKHPYIVAVTDEYNVDKEVCINAGMNDYLAKPIDIVQLKAIIKSVHL